MTDKQFRYLTYAEAAEQFKVSVSTLRNWIRSGYIKQYRKPADKKAYVRTDEIERLRNAEPK